MRNRGELAEGWYDPATLQKAQASATSNDGAPATGPRVSPTYDRVDEADESSDEDAVGPALPGNKPRSHPAGKKPGPAIPNSQDLELQRGTFPKAASPIKAGLGTLTLFQNSNRKTSSCNAKISVTIGASTERSKKSDSTTLFLALKPVPKTVC